MLLGYGFESDTEPLALIKTVSVFVVVKIEITDAGSVVTLIAADWELPLRLAEAFADPVSETSAETKSVCVIPFEKCGELRIAEVAMKPR